MVQRREGRQTGTGGRGATRRPTDVPATGRTRATLDDDASARTKARRPSAVGESGISASSGRVKSGSVEAKTSLRSKFMLVMAGLTGVTMIAMGIILALTSNLFVQGISMHKGVEIAKSVSTLVRVQMDAMGGSGFSKEQKDEILETLKQYMSSATTWKQGDNLSGSYSDILCVFFDGGVLGGHAIKGEIQTQGGAIGTPYPLIYVPRIGDVLLGDDIKVYELERDYGERGLVKVYRYRLKIPGPEGRGFGMDEIVIDVDANAIGRVNFQMYLYAGIAVLVAMMGVVYIAFNFSAKITKPVDFLVRDMQIVSAGDLSHRTKPHSNDEISVLAHEFNRMTSNLKVAQEAMVEQEKAAFELNIAREVQQQLLPGSVPTLEHFEIASYYLGAKALSGDYFDFIPLGEGIWGFIIADVSGKGVPGSLVMAQTRTVFRLVANQYPDKASETLKKTNRLIAKQIKRGMFVTAFYAILNENTGQLTYSSAGHNPLVIYRAATKTYELATPKGIAIGFNEGPLFDKNIQEESALLGPGDSFVLYTDGFPEAMNDNDEEFGDDEFYQVIADTGHLAAAQMKDGIVQAIAEHRGRAPQSDDLTLIAVKRKA